MKNLHTVELRLNSEIHIIDRTELSIDPDMQMRTQMNQETVEQYADNIQAILEQNPIDVIEVEDALETQWYVVDGFHRYHAAVLADVTNIRVRLMRGTYTDAVQYAMSANWENGLRPKNEDATRSIAILLDTAPDFGFDSKAVNKWVQAFGIPASTARNHTKALVEQVKAKRDAEIIRLDAEGLSSRSIASEVGVSDFTVREVIKENAARKCPQDKTSQEEDAVPFDTDEPMFDDESLDTTPAINPADAFNKALAEHEETRQENTTNPSEESPVIPNTKNENEMTPEQIVMKALKDGGAYEWLTQADVMKAIKNIAQGK